MKRCKECYFFDRTEYEKPKGICYVNPEINIRYADNCACRFFDSGEIYVQEGTKPLIVKISSSITC